MTDLGPLEIPADVLRDVYAHAESGWPEEVCGLLLGPRDSALVDLVRRCQNVQNRLHAEDPARFPRDATTAYNLDAQDLLLFNKSLRGDQPVKVIYHSHVDTGAYFSAEDRLAALMGCDEPAYPVQYLVVDARQDGARGAKLFAWVDGDFAEVAQYGQS